jgi:hypothetical protein
MYAAVRAQTENGDAKAVGPFENDYLAQRYVNWKNSYEIVNDYETDDVWAVAPMETPDPEIVGSI